MAKKKLKNKEKKLFKGKHICEDETTGRLIRIISKIPIADGEIERRINMDKDRR